MMPDLRAYFNQQIDRMIALLSDLITIESPTANKTAVDRMSERVAAELKALGDVLAKHPNIIVVTDDIYEHISWNDEPFANIVTRCPALLVRATWYSIPLRKSIDISA